MTLEEFFSCGYKTTIYPHEFLPDPPEGYVWKAQRHNGELNHYLLQEKPKRSDCNCSKSK